MIDEGIRARLIAHAGLLAIISQRVYNNIAPQGATIPHIVFRRVSAQRDLTHSGPSGVARARFQFDCLGKTPTEAKQIAANLRNALHGYSGTISGQTIMRSEMINEVDGFDVDFGALVSADFLISYTES